MSRRGSLAAGTPELGIRFTDRGDEAAPGFAIDG
jgi:hypothetical protein